MPLAGIRIAALPCTDLHLVTLKLTFWACLVEDLDTIVYEQELADVLWTLVCCGVREGPSRTVARIGLIYI